MRVSAHCLIRRDGEIVQYVPFDKRAWHAGVSQYQGRERCNDFSIGIELEGTDTLAYTDAQYQQLAAVTRALIDCYPDIANNMTGHCDIAPDRKPIPVLHLIGHGFVRWSARRQHDAIYNLTGVNFRAPV